MGTAIGVPAGGRRWKPRLGVAQRLFLAFFGATAFVVVASLLALLTFREYAAGFDRLTTTHLPALIAAGDLAQRAQMLAANAPNLATADSHFGRQALASDLHRQWTELTRILTARRGATSESEPLEEMVRDAEALRADIDLLDGAVSRQIDANTLAQTIFSRLGRMLERIRAEESEEMARLGAVKPDNPLLLALRDWAAAAKNMIVVMLSVATVDNTTRLQRLTADFTSLDNRAEAAGARLPGREAGEIERTLKLYGAGADGIFSARLGQLKTASDVTAVLLETRRTAGRFVGSADTLLTAIQKQVNDEAGYFAHLIARYMRAFAAVAALCMLGAAGIILYINRAVVRRLRQLNASMTSQLAGRPTRFPTEGDDEIAEMARAAEQFVETIERRGVVLRVTIDNMADGVAMFDQDLRLTAWNRNFQHMLDLPDEVLEKRPTYADYLHILAERGEFGTEHVEAELRRRIDAIHRELPLERIRPDGRIIEVRRNAVPDGGFVLIYSDITERKRSEIEVRAARDAAEAAYRDLKAAQANLIQAEKMASLGQLTAGIAHEIKNPLNFVNNFAGLSIELLDELKESAAPGIVTLDEDIRAEIDETVEMLTSNLDKIAEHGKRADNIVKSMLEHSRGVSGERREVDFNALVDEALNLAYHGARAQDQSFNITLERDFQPGLAPVEVAPQEITRVFLNLFSNGFYATNRRARDSGNGSFRPTLAVATRDLGDAVEIRVRDNGTGIPPEIRDKLFQPFFTTKPTGEGTGLGLSISYDIITQQHSGTITVESEPGAYIEFTIRLPRRTTVREAA
jgi:signal transduction histidine kinase